MSVIYLNQVGGTKLPYENMRDPFNAANATRYNIVPFAWSGFIIKNNNLYNEIAFKMQTGPGYEGICFPLNKFNLTNGQQYRCTLTITIPEPATFIGTPDFPFGAKHSGTVIPDGNNFNIPETVRFDKTNSPQTKSFTFTATTNNYLVLLMSQINAGTSNDVIITVDNIIFEKI